MRKQNLEFKFTELSDVYNKDKNNDTSIVLDIRSVNKEPYSLSPAFDSDIERYCWVPEKNNTQLKLDFFVKDGTKIYVDNELLDEKSYKVFSKDSPKEYIFRFENNDSIATYTLATLPINFPPLNINVANSSLVSEGNIFTSVFIVPKVVHWPLIIKDVIRYFPELKKYYIKFRYKYYSVKI